MPDLSLKKYTHTDKTVFNQQIESGAITLFDDAYNELVSFSIKNRLTKPKKGEFLTTILRENMVNFDPKNYFNK